MCEHPSFLVFAMASTSTPHQLRISTSALPTTLLDILADLFLLSRELPITLVSMSPSPTRHTGRTNLLRKPCMFLTLSSKNLK